MQRQLAIIDVRPGERMESQSGLQLNAPRIYGAFQEPERRGKVAAIIMHPVSNFMGHYLIVPLAERSICCMGLNSRYIGNDANLLMERVILDLGAGVRFLKARGYSKIILIGNSGGAALISYYQRVAENPCELVTPAGDPIGHTRNEIIPCDGIVLCAAHAGRSRILEEWLDPAVTDENDPSKSKVELDLYFGPQKPPYSAEFVSRFRQAQIERRNRIEAWVWDRLRHLRSTRGDDADEAFIIHRTHCDPRLLDLTLDTNDREIGSIWGDPCTVNYAPNAVGRFTTLKAFLSQWASCSKADGPRNLARTSVRVQLFDYTADASTFPSTIRLWQDAAGARASSITVKGGNHYLAGQPALVRLVADRIADWAHNL
jgi:hypothetical protein